MEQQLTRRSCGTLRRDAARAPQLVVMFKNMNELLDHLEVWKNSKNTIFKSENYKVYITGVLGSTKKSRYINIDTDKLVARATLWESGELELEAIDIATNTREIFKSVTTTEVWRLDDELNWWLSEIAIY